jgi:molybdate transport system substrate-binding protein
MKKPFNISLLLLTVLAACIYLLLQENDIDTCNDAPNNAVTLYCAAGLRQPISQIIETYTQLTRRKVNLIYNGSGALLSQIKLGYGDLYLPANIAYVHDAAHAGLTTQFSPVAFLTAAIVVHKDCTTIQSLQDLTQPGVRISFADHTAAIGRFARATLSKHGLYTEIQKNIIVTKPTVNNIVEDVSLGSADATIAWAAVAKNHSNLRTIPVPIFSQPRQQTAIALLETSKNQKAAQHLADYISTSEHARQIFIAHGFQVPALEDI